MRHIASLALLLTLAAASSSFAADGPVRNIAGTYAARGTGVDGKTYGATVTLTRNGETYLVRWKFDDADFTGVGILRGDTLSVGWTNHDKAGVVIYTVSEGSVLKGTWADGSTNGKTYPETLTPQP